MKVRIARMAFLLKSVFWLGIVYSSMPFNETPTLDFSPSQAALLCNEATAFLKMQSGPRNEAQRRSTAEGCTALALTASVIRGEAITKTTSRASLRIPERSPSDAVIGGLALLPNSAKHIPTPEGAPRPRWPFPTAKGYKREAQTHSGFTTAND